MFVNLLTSSQRASFDREENLLHKNEFERFFFWMDEQIDGDAKSIKPSYLMDFHREINVWYEQNQITWATFPL